MRFVDKLIAKVHASILSIHNIVGEKEASDWLSQSDKGASTTKQAKTPPKKLKAKGKPGASADDQQGSAADDSSVGTLEREAIRDVLREQYLSLREMDDLVRDKLFILQVTFDAF